MRWNLVRVAVMPGVLVLLGRFLDHRGLGVSDISRAVIEYPLLRYAITTKRFPDANTYMFVGNGSDDVSWIEVAAEDEDGQTWVVFHAMMLTTKTGAEVYTYSEGAVDLRGQCTRQRPFIGPQYGKEC